MERFKLLIRIILSATVVSVPFFFATVFSDFFELPKISFIYLVFLVGLFLLGLKFLINKKVEFVRTPFDLPLFLILVSLALSTYFGANRVQSAMNGLAPLGIGILFYYLVTQLLDPLEEADFEGLIKVFLASAGLLGLLSFLSYFNLHLFPLDFARSRFFTPAGGEFTLLVILALAAPLALSRLLESVPPKIYKDPWFYITVADLALFGLLVILKTSLFGLLLTLPTLAELFLSDKEVLRRYRPVLSFIGLALAMVFVLFYLPLSFNRRFVDFRTSYPRLLTLDPGSSWVVSIQTIRDYPIFGSGPATFLADFVRYRPAFLNNTPFWNQRFAAPVSEPYQVLATTGLLGFLFLLFFGWTYLVKTLRAVQSPEGRRGGFIFPLLVILIAFVFSVPAPSLRVLFFIFLALFVLRSNLTSRKTFGNVFPIIPLVLIVVANIALGYLLYNLMSAEARFKKALDAAGGNDVRSSLTNLAEAIRINPYRDNYHLSAASLYFTLANNLAASPNLTDADRQTLTQLLNTSIVEAKTAVSLDPFNGTNLETLASIYRNIAGAVQNAGSWAANAYQQAILIEPMNPDLRFNLGSLFFAAGNYEQAANLFADTVRLKNDVPNYHYNLAWALRNRGYLGQAVDEMTVVTRMVDPNTPDGQKAKQDLEDFNKLLEEALKQSSSNQPSTQGGLNVAVPSEGALPATASKVNLPTEASPSGVKKK